MKLDCPIKTKQPACCTVYSKSPKKRSSAGLFFHYASDWIMELNRTNTLEVPYTIVSTYIIIYILYI